MPVVGNGIALGLTNGHENFAPQLRVQSGIYGGVEAGFGVNVGTTLGTGDAPSSLMAIGVTTDPTKSGLTAYFSNLDIGVVSSLKLGKYILKY